LHDVRAIPSRWRPGDVVLLAQGSEPGLVRFLWQSAPLLSLAHDVSDGGLELALAEAAEWSGTAPLQATDRYEEGVVVACARADVSRLAIDLVEIGVV